MSYMKNKIEKRLDAYEDLLEACKATREYFVNFDGIDPIKIAVLVLKVSTAIEKAEAAN